MMPGDEQGSRAPWERLLPADGRRGETDVAFAAFCAYCNSPEGEDSIRGLVKSLPSCRTLLERWSLRHRWRQRRSAWRDHLAGIAREEIERLEREKTAEAKKRREQETKEQLEDVQLLRRKGRQMIEYPLAERTMVGPDGKTIVVKPIRWSMDTGGNFIQIAAKLGSRAVEEPRSAVHDQVEERIELESTSVQIEGDDKDKQQEKEKEKEKDEGKNKEPK